MTPHGMLGGAISAELNSRKAGNVKVPQISRPPIDRKRERPGLC